MKRQFGDVSLGKVTVDLVTDYGTPQEKYVRETIPLSEKDALLEVEVKTGHRTTPMVEAHIAMAESKRLAAGRALLAQQSYPGSSGSSGGSLGQYWEQQQRLIAASSRGFPFRGAVGYRPEITVLPEGVFWNPRVVVSGDRRYVRFSNPPSFFAILAVDTFNFITGNGTNNGGGAGGGGGGGFGGGGGLF